MVNLSGLGIMTKNKDCLMCVHTDYTWFELMMDYCGVTDNPGEKLCDVHQDIFREQLQEQIKI